ncbi:hypothetical protein LHJ74_27875 [Streptomyces sp. N2-109]|uniref:Secreted protein n=1 Tax=Streptomyces gossypii TaxID=2883101 RepID=A0ABT2JZ26_9ACTN|nr:hypothetical protein [Streptomyces gossypii]MCT2592946.1 hypothetical protein [Streptomyces gossypii]MCT2593679.1 hypothetical protein [Streptomyces gossypii]
MSAISLILLSAAAVATAMGGAALHTARGLHRELSAVRAQLERAEAARTPAAGSERIPAARSTPAEEIRAAVTEALAEERERELAEARAFWAAQEARDTGPEGGALLAGHGTEYELVSDAPDPDGAALLEALLEGRLDGLEGLHGLLQGEAFVPRQGGQGDCGGALEDGLAYGAELPYGSGPREEGDGDTERLFGPEHEAAELAAARRRHPSHPDFNLNGDPVGPADPAAAGDPHDKVDHADAAGYAALSGGPVLADHARTVRRLSELAEARTPLADVRPGPLGTPDVYAFEDGTTLCMSPGHHQTAQHLADALTAGLPPVLLGGSGITGAYSLTFAVGDERVYTLADRIIASL